MLCPTTATFNELYVRKDGEWAQLLWTDSGRVILLSSWGDYSFYWSHIGSKTLEDFLSDLGLQYMGKKLLGEHFWVYDGKATTEYIAEQVKELADDLELLDQEDEPDTYRELEERISSEDASLGDFVRGYSSFSEWADETQFEDAWEWSMTKPDEGWTRFWHLLWVPYLQPALAEIAAKQKKEKADEKEA